MLPLKLPWWGEIHGKRYKPLLSGESSSNFLPPVGLKPTTSGLPDGCLRILRHIILNKIQIILYYRHVDNTFSWKQYLNMLLTACFDVAKVVAPVVTNSSPEGNVCVDPNVLGKSIDFWYLL